jgi:hypothetical protein
LASLILLERNARNFTRTRVGAHRKVRSGIQLFIGRRRNVLLDAQLDSSRHDAPVHIKIKPQLELTESHAQYDLELVTGVDVI